MLATIESVRVSIKTQHRVIILKEDGGARHLPIWIGQYECDCIAMHLKGQRTSRPLPYDLFGALAEATGATVSGARISGPTDDVFTASIELSFRGDRVELDARPSDAIMLALQAGAPIWIAQESMNWAGVVLQRPPEPGEA